jgi:C-terminal processing protease CtpA/Prc
MKGFFAMLFIFCTAAVAAQNTSKLTPADKVYGLSKFWQEVNYNFVYLENVDRKMWDNRYRELITVVQNTKTDYEYFRELEKFCALLKDGHTNIYLPYSVKRMYTEFGDYQLFIKNIEGRAVIVRTNLGKKEELPAGSEIIEVNGLTAENYISQQVTPYISSSADYVLKDYGIERMLGGLEGDSYQVKIKKPDGTMVVLNLTHKPVAEKELYPPLLKSSEVDFRWLDKQVAYVALNTFVSENTATLFTKLLPELYKAKGLVIDLRKNGGGSTSVGLHILQYLSNDSLFYGAKSITRNHIATYKAWGQYTQPKDTLTDGDAKKYLLAAKDRYYYQFDYTPDTIRLSSKKIVVPIVLLLGHNTASAAEDFLIYADNQQHMIKMGENSFGSTGQPYTFPLVGGYTARVCTKKDTYADGRLFVGCGIKPDIEVKQTLQDYISQKDAVLDKAFSHLKQQIK